MDSTPLLGPGFFTFPNQWKLTRGQIRNSGKALLGALLQYECVCVCGGGGGQWKIGRTNNRFPDLLVPR